jgi:hypothetical protein
VSEGIANLRRWVGPTQVLGYPELTQRTLILSRFSITPLDDRTPSGISYTMHFCSEVVRTR